MSFWVPWRAREERKEPKPRRLLHEPVLAYRAWRTVGERLLSCTCGCVWQPRRRMTATCNQLVSHTGVPAWDCRCGFYAYKSEEALAGSTYVRMGHEATVRGRVALWGRVVDHELGYRAEHAYPQFLYLNGDAFDDVIRRLAECYAVECVPGWLLTH